jgi:hypothetical protein
MGAPPMSRSCRLVVPCGCGPVVLAFARLGCGLCGLDPLVIGFRSIFS